MAKRAQKRARLSWDSAITDARRRQKAAQRLVVRLERAIQTFRERKAEGAPFPGVGAR
jgi:hypothetical protein